MQGNACARPRGVRYRVVGTIQRSAVSLCWRNSSTCREGINSGSSSSGTRSMSTSCRTRSSTRRSSPGTACRRALSRPIHRRCRSRASAQVSSPATGRAGMSRPGQVESRCPTSLGQARSRRSASVGSAGRTWRGAAQSARTPLILAGCRFDRQGPVKRRPPCVHSLRQAGLPRKCPELRTAASLCGVSCAANNYSWSPCRVGTC